MESLDLVSEPRRRGGVSQQAREEEGLPEVEPGCRHTLCGLRGLLVRLTLEVHGHSLQLINCSYLSACSSSSSTYFSQLWTHQRLPTALKIQAGLLSRGCKTPHDLPPVPSVTFLLPRSLSPLCCGHTGLAAPRVRQAPTRSLRAFAHALGIFENASDLLQASARKSPRWKSLR